MKELYAWMDTIQERMPQLSKPQATVLALWSFGMLLVKNCSLSAVTVVLSALLGQSPNTMRQRLKEWYRDREHKSGYKRGTKRREVVTQTCFAPLLQWVLSIYKGEYLALGLDAMALGDRLVVPAVSVLYRGCAIPVAWTIVAANRKGKWKKEWLKMLRLIGKAVPHSMKVFVLTDRGLYAPWLFQRITRLGWHPMLRVQSNRYFRPQGRIYRQLKEFVPQKGDIWSGRGTAFKTNTLECTLLAWWSESGDEPWFILTDIEPRNAQVSWYALRSWIEHGFKFMKREGFQWQRTRMTDPGRAGRLWLALSVATLRLVSMATEVGEVENFDFLQAVDQQSSHSHRQVSLFRFGWINLLVQLIHGETLPQGILIPEPLPETPIPRPPLQLSG
jgi:hypothetical protein